MKAVGEVIFRSESIPVHPPYGPIQNYLSVIFPSARLKTRTYPAIKVLLKPVPNFCLGMSYSLMETDDPQAQEVEVELEITKTLIYFLLDQGQTSIKLLHAMIQTLEIDKGKTC